MRVTIPDLEVVRLVAHANGYDDVDVEPGANNVSITASGKNGTRKVTQKTTREACIAFIGLFGIDIVNSDVILELGD